MTSQMPYTHLSMAVFGFLQLNGRFEYYVICRHNYITSDNFQSTANNDGLVTQKKRKSQFLRTVIHK